MKISNVEIAKYVAEKIGRKCSHTNISHAKFFHPGLSGFELGDAVVEDRKKYGKFLRKRDDDRPHKRKQNFRISDGIYNELSAFIGGVFNTFESLVYNFNREDRSYKAMKIQFILATVREIEAIVSSRAVCENA